MLEQDGKCLYEALQILLMAHIEPKPLEEIMNMRTSSQGMKELKLRMSQVFSYWDHAPAGPGTLENAREITKQMVKQ